MGGGGGGGGKYNETYYIRRGEHDGRDGIAADH